MPEIMLDMPAQNIAHFLAYIVVLYHLQHFSSYITANLQQICCMIILLVKLRLSAIPELFSVPFQKIWHDSINAIKKGFFETFKRLLQICSNLRQPRHFLETGAIRLRSACKTEVVTKFAETIPHLQPANPILLD